MIDNRYASFDRATWSRLRDSIPLPLGADDVERLRGINEQLDLDEVETIYLPLSRLLNLYVTATQDLFRATDTFLGRPTKKVPYVIGLGGSVAVGKSTTARVLQALLARWSDHPEVALVTTDNFLYSNAELNRRGLMSRKGFPQSYDVRALMEFLTAIKSGASEARSPVYSHLDYDIVPGEEIVVRGPDVVIVEGLNVLQPPTVERGRSQVFVSDFFDFSVYVDAPLDLIKRWYVERFMTLRDTVFQQPDSYFRTYAELDEGEAEQVALGIWDSINGPNLVENIEPTRGRADLILEKGPGHRVQQVFLRKL